MQERENSSKVTEILARIEAEYFAVRQGLTGFAESARHTAITARMVNVGRLHQDLQAIVGDNAIKLIAERLEALPG